MKAYAVINTGMVDDTYIEYCAAMFADKADAEALRDKFISYIKQMQESYGNMAKDKSGYLIHNEAYCAYYQAHNDYHSVLNSYKHDSIGATQFVNDNWQVREIIIH